MFERYTVAYKSRVTSVNLGYFYQWEIFLSFLGWTDNTFHYITGLQAEQLDLWLWNVNIIGRRKVVIIGWAQESITVLHDFQYAGSCEYIVEFVRLFTFYCRLAFGSNIILVVVLLLCRTLLLLCRTLVGIVTIVVVWRIVIAEAKTGALLRLLCCRNRSFCFGGFEFADELWRQFYFFGWQILDGDKVILCFRQDRTFIRCRLGGCNNFLGFCFFRLCSFYFSFCRNGFRCFRCGSRFLFYFARTSRFAFGYFSLCCGSCGYGRLFSRLCCLYGSLYGRCFFGFPFCEFTVLVGCEYLVRCFFLDRYARTFLLVPFTFFF